MATRHCIVLLRLQKLENWRGERCAVKTYRLTNRTGGICSKPDACAKLASMVSMRVMSMLSANCILNASPSRGGLKVTTPQHNKLVTDTLRAPMAALCRSIQVGCEVGVRCSSKGARGTLLQQTERLCFTHTIGEAGREVKEGRTRDEAIIGDARACGEGPEQQHNG